MPGLNIGSSFQPLAGGIAMLPSQGPRAAILTALGTKLRAMHDPHKASSLTVAGGRVSAMSDERSGPTGVWTAPASPTTRQPTVATSSTPRRTAALSLPRSVLDDTTWSTMELQGLGTPINWTTEDWTIYIPVWFFALNSAVSQYVISAAVDSNNRMALCSILESGLRVFYGQAATETIPLTTSVWYLCTVSKNSGANRVRLRINNTMTGDLDISNETGSRGGGGTTLLRLSGVTGSSLNGMAGGRIGKTMIISGTPGSGADMLDESAEATDRLIRQLYWNIHRVGDYKPKLA